MPLFADFEYLLQQSKHCKFFISGKDHRKNLV